MDQSENSLWWNLPADVQSDILSRLPGKKLIRSKLVSWGWYDVISYLCTPRFAPTSKEAAFCGIIFRDRQREGVGTISPSTLRLADFRRRSKFRVRYFPIMARLRQNYPPEDLQDSCNGILLVVQHDNDGGAHYSVSNPTTGECIQVPPPPQRHHNRTTRCCFASLAFEPTKSLHYKIVCTPGGYITNPLKVETFSSEIGKWLGYAVSIDSVIDGVEWIHRSAYLDGRMYRLLKTNYLACIHVGNCSGLLRLQAIELPNFCGDTVYMGEDDCYGSIGISRQRLLYSTRDRNGSTMLVYMLKDDGIWLLKHTITIDDLLVRHPTTFGFSALKETVNDYWKEKWFNFNVFHPNCDTLFLITPNIMLYYSPEEKFLELFHVEGGEREIIVGQYYSFPYSHCPVILWNAFQRTCANLVRHMAASNERVEGTVNGLSK